MANSLVDALNEISDTYAASDPSLIGAKELAEQKLDLRRMDGGSGFLAGFLKSAGVGGLAALGTSNVKSKKEKLNKEYQAAMDMPDDASKLAALSKSKELSPLAAAFRLHQTETDAKINEAKRIAEIENLSKLPGAARGLYPSLPNTHIDLNGQAQQMGGGQQESEGGGQMDPQMLSDYQRFGDPALVRAAQEKRMALEQHAATNEMDFNQESKLSDMHVEKEQNKNVLDKYAEMGDKAQEIRHFSQQVKSLEPDLDWTGPGAELKLGGYELAAGTIGNEAANRKVSAANTLSALQAKAISASKVPGLSLTSKSIENRFADAAPNITDTPASRANKLQIMDANADWASQARAFGFAALNRGIKPKDADSMANSFDEKFPLIVRDKQGRTTSNPNRPNIFQFYGLQNPSELSGNSQGGAPQMGAGQAPSPLDALMAEKQRRMQGSR